METKSLKVIIAADNALVVNGLRHHLENNFGENLHICSCYDARVLLRSVDWQTDVAVIDYFFEGMSGEQLKKQIKTVNPGVKVVMHSSREDVVSSLKQLMQEGKPQAAKKFSYKLERQYL